MPPPLRTFVLGGGTSSASLTGRFAFPSSIGANFANVENDSDRLVVAYELGVLRLIEIDDLAARGGGGTEV